MTQAEHRTLGHARDRMMSQAKEAAKQAAGQAVGGALASPESQQA
jgi:hypothetical protein